MRGEENTWSPSSGTGPEPMRRSKALTPPEFGRSKKSVIEVAEEAAGHEKVGIENSAVDKEMIDNERALLVGEGGDGEVEEIGGDEGRWWGT